jgi:putative membrane protein
MIKGLFEGRRVLKHGLIAATTLLTCIAVQADHTDTHKGTHGDKAGQFIQKALDGGQMEVRLGQLAQQKAQSQDVKNLGATLVKDHTQADQELQQLASTKNLQPSSTARAEHSEKKHDQMLTKLENQSGAEFDKAFVRMAIKDHRKDIKEFERARTEISDADLTAFIDKTLPTLRNHLQMAESAARAVGVDASTITAGEREETGAVGGTAPGVTGAAREDRSSSSGSFGPRSDTAHPNGYNGATSTDASGTVNQNNPSAKVEGNVGDHEIKAEGTVNKNDSSSSTDTTTKHKIFQKGDGKVLGLSTDKNDGKFLGIIPDPHKKAKANVDVNTDNGSASVGTSATTESGSSSATSSTSSTTPTPQN